ncbi:Acg family FMN-binding oxidoreductase [Pseudahrensia aquimaris]|uniref:Acg family FMN-binding oxidoreductase n=1 Tax=Pseudahrensia aquimaris TaxID=744461 RepID=A0ABW3FDN6_9HYPH
MNRRKFLALVGGGTILAAGGTVGAVALRVPTKALEPWAQAGSLYSEPRKRALSFAILAPNPHNRQPWLVDLSQADTVVLTVDKNKMLPHTDPLNRQITIGLGCFLEVMTMAAAEQGFRVDLDLFPEGESAEVLDGRPVAVARFTKDDTVARDPLFAHVLDRRSLKEPYDMTRPVPNEAAQRIVAAAKWGTSSIASVEPESIKRIRRITHDALVIETETPRAFKESVDLFRIGKAEVEANPDGIDFSGPMFEVLHSAGLMTREAALDASSQAFQAGFEAVLANADTAMGHVWSVTRGNTRLDQIAAGRDWVRLNLTATAEGVATQPLSQALQEYPEMADLYAQTHKLLAPQGGTVQMLARLGYAASVPPSPRWPLEAKITGV